MMVFRAIAYVFDELRALVAVILLEIAFAVFPDSHQAAKLLLAAALHSFARDQAAVK